MGIDMPIVQGESETKQGVEASRTEGSEKKQRTSRPCLALPQTGKCQDEPSEQGRGKAEDEMPRGKEKGKFLCGKDADDKENDQGWEEAAWWEAYSTHK
jgi:hypothetical protein